MTLTVTKAARGVWCDYCKDRWGKVGQEWHTNAMKPASYTVVSSHPKSQNVNRNYCHACAVEVATWPDGSVWHITEQTEYLMKQEELPNV